MLQNTDSNSTRSADTLSQIDNSVDQDTWVGRFVMAFGNTIAWLFPALMIAICTQVVLRKMGNNLAWLDDAQWWIYGLALTVGFVYAITTQSHVRVDILFMNFRPSKKARTEIVGLGWMLLPFLVLMTDILFNYSWASFQVREGSDSPNGLHRLYLLKMALPWIFIIAMAATLSILIRHLRVIATVRLWTVLLAIFPAAWFVLERLSHTVLWWYVRLTNPDIRSSRINKEPLLEPTMWIGLAILLSVITISFISHHRSAKRLST